VARFASPDANAADPANVVRVARTTIVATHLDMATM
jgi:hypothetical protein